jgi:hypothetical protein
MLTALDMLTASRQTSLGGEAFYECVLADGELWTQFFRFDNGYVLRFPEIADFQISTDGSHISCRPALEANPEWLLHLYQNHVQPLALSKLGKLVLHGSAVEIGAGAIALIGQSGLGKSTLAASFALNGQRFLTDDGLLVEESPLGEHLLVHPSHPAVRLWEDSRTCLLGDRTVRPARRKISLAAGAAIAHCAHPRPLLCLYFLGEGATTEVEIEPLSQAQALHKWIRNSFFLDAEEHDALLARFDRISRITGQSRSFHLDYPRRFELLPVVRHAIVEHANKLACAT